MLGASCFLWMAEIAIASEKLFEAIDGRHFAEKISVNCIS